MLSVSAEGAEVVASGAVRAGPFGVAFDVPVATQDVGAFGGPDVSVHGT